MGSLRYGPVGTILPTEAMANPSIGPEVNAEVARRQFTIRRGLDACIDNLY
jgi:hypothetical protein